jgi:Mn-dependent DtxR family transcriptional regulator
VIDIMASMETNNTRKVTGIAKAFFERHNLLYVFFNDFGIKSLISRYAFGLSD